MTNAEELEFFGLLCLFYSCFEQIFGAAANICIILDKYQISYGSLGAFLGRAAGRWGNHIITDQYAILRPYAHNTSCGANK